MSTRQRARERSWCRTKRVRRPRSARMRTWKRARSISRSWSRPRWRRSGGVSRRRRPGPAGIRGNQDDFDVQYPGFTPERESREHTLQKTSSRPGRSTSSVSSSPKLSSKTLSTSPTSMLPCTFWIGNAILVQIAAGTHNTR